MDDTVRINTARRCAEFLEEHKGEDTVLIDVREQSSWTDYFIVTTVRSQGHLKGLLRQLKGFLQDEGLEIHSRTKPVGETTWHFVDCGFLVVHLMEREAREFYELEKLWHLGQVLVGQTA